MIASWPRLVTVVVARILLFGVLGLAFWATAPMLLGWTPTTVVSGSMKPAIGVGDVVVSQHPGARELRPGQVLLVDDPDQRGKLRLHRIAGQDASGSIILKGDANAEADSTPVQRELVRGVGTLRVPLIGSPIVWLRQGNWIPLLLTVAALGLLIAIAFGRFAHPGPRPGASSGAPPRSPSLGGAMGRHRKSLAAAGTVAAATVLVAVFGLTPGGRTAHAAFSGTHSKPASFATAAGPSYHEVVMADQPLAFFEAETGDPTFDSTRQSEARSYGVTVAGGAGRGEYGTALNLSAPQSNLGLTQLHPGVGPRAFTLEVWFRTTAPGGRLMGFGNTYTGVSGYYDRVVYLSGGKVFFGIGPWGPTRLSTPGTYNDGQWHHVVAARDDAGMRLVVDGTVISGPAGATQDYAGYWRIGYDNLAGWPSDPQTNSFQGFVDDVAIYPKALTADQAVYHYQSGIGG